MPNYWTKDDDVRVMAWIDARAIGKATKNEDKYVWSQCRKLALGVARKVKGYPGCTDDPDDLADDVASHLIMSVLPIYRPDKGAMYSYLTASAGHYLSWLWRKQVGEYTHHTIKRIPEVHDIDDQIDLASDDTVDADLIAVTTGFADWCQVHTLDLFAGYDIDKMTICYLIPAAMLRADTADQSQEYARRVLAELARRSGLQSDIVVAHVKSLMQEYMSVIPV